MASCLVKSTGNFSAKYNKEFYWLNCDKANLAFHTIFILDLLCEFCDLIVKKELT